MIYSFPFAIQPLQAAFEASGAHRSKPRRRSAPSPLRSFLARRLAARAARLRIRGRSDVRAHARRVRRRAHGRRQHPGQHEGAFRSRSTSTSRRSSMRRRTSSSAGLLVFSFAVLLSVYILNRAHAARARLSCAHEHAFTRRCARPTRLRAARRQPSSTLAGITAVFGPSGSGKTDLAAHHCRPRARARAAPSAFDGETWQSGESRCRLTARRVGYVFQDGRLFPHMTVAQNLEFAQRRSARRATPLHRPRGARSRRSTFARCSDGARRRCPGGEQQRVAIARARCCEARGSCSWTSRCPRSTSSASGKSCRTSRRCPRSSACRCCHVTHNVGRGRATRDATSCCSRTAESPRTVMSAEIFERSDWVS
mgnify:CR=1 FL=1